MKVQVLDADLNFPPVNVAGEHGLLAVGGDLSSARLLAAYEHGAFPWFMEEDPILWWAPPERAVLPVLELAQSVQKHAQRTQPEALPHHLGQGL